MHENEVCKWLSYYFCLLCYGLFYLYLTTYCAVWIYVFKLKTYNLLSTKQKKKKKKKTTLKKKKKKNPPPPPQKKKTPTVILFLKKKIHKYIS